MESKKKIGIVSYNCHTDHMNYGAVLHSYAFQQYLNRKGINSVILDYKPKIIERINYKYPVLNSKRFWRYKGFLRNVYLWGILGFFPNLRKYNKFQKFFAEHYKKTKRCYKQRELMKMQRFEESNISTWVVESDVVWKLYAKGEFDEIFFLQAPFMRDSRKVAYSPTISSRPFDEEESQIFLRYVSDFFAISCRDEDGAKYLSHLVGKTVEWVLDPTLLLDAIDYEKIMKEPKYKPKHYLMAYNCMKNDVEMLNQSQKIADRMGLEMIEISNFNINKKKFKHRVLTDIGVEEFLWYLSHAELVICNAFHGCCFSVIFRKEFFVLQRDESDFRMKSITRGLGLDGRYITCTNKVIPDKFESIDYDAVYEKLAKLREKSYEFIERNILT